TLAATLSGLTASTSTATASTATAAFSRRAVRIARLHLRAVLETQLAFGDDRLAGREAFVDDDDLAHPLSNRDGTLFNRLILFHDEDELSVLSDLHGLTGNDGGFDERRESETHARELSRPEPEIFVGKAR